MLLCMCDENPCKKKRERDKWWYKILIRFFLPSSHDTFKSCCRDDEWWKYDNDDGNLLRYAIDSNPSYKKDQRLHNGKKSVREKEKKKIALLLPHKKRRERKNVKYTRTPAILEIVNHFYCVSRETIWAFECRSSETFITPLIFLIDTTWAEWRQGWSCLW